MHGTRLSASRKLPQMADLKGLHNTHDSLLAFVHSKVPQTVGDIFFDGQMWKQRKLLEDKSNAALGGFNIHICF